MSRMLLAAEDDPGPLKKPDERRRPPHVRPLMNLVGGDADEAEGKQEDLGKTPPFAIQGEDEHGQQEGNDDHRDVAIDVEEPPAREVVGIDVMHAERPKQPAADQGQRLPAPGIGRPMNEARHEIGPDRADRRRPPGSHHSCAGILSTRTNWTASRRTAVEMARTSAARRPRLNSSCRGRSLRAGSTAFRPGFTNVSLAQIISDQPFCRTGSRCKAHAFWANQQSYYARINPTCATRTEIGTGKPKPLDR